MPKLLLIVIDGLRTEALECAHIRCLNRLMQLGATAQIHDRHGINLALPALTTMFTSVAPEVHGVTTNMIASWPQSLSYSLPALLHYHHLSCAMFYSHDQLIRLFPPQSLESALLINSNGIRNVDRKLGEAAAYHLQREKPDFCCLYLQGCDITGTHFGYLSEPYLESIELADQTIDLLLQQLQLVGLHHEYVTMVVAGHQGSWDNDNEKAPLPWITCGPGIIDTLGLSRPVSNLDLAPTIAYFMKIPPHPNWQGRIVQEIFSPTNLKSLSAEQKHLQLYKRAAIRPAA